MMTANLTAPMQKKRSLDDGAKIDVSQGESCTIVTPNEKRRRLDAVLEKPPANPGDFILAAFRANGCNARIQMSTSSPLFHSPTEDEIAAYNQDVIKATRERNFDKLRVMLQEGKTLQCCNRFGESLMHMACRRGFTDVVEFLVKEAKCSLFVRDDYGRTAMHDAAWSPRPNFELMDFLIDQTPELLLLSDVRGHTPFSYVRKEHWKEWISFLEKRVDKLTVGKVGDAAPAFTVA